MQCNFEAQYDLNVEVIFSFLMGFILLVCCYILYIQYSCWSMMQQELQNTCISVQCLI